MAKDIEYNKKVGFVFLLILAVGFFLRVAFLDRYPVGFKSDEALIGWRALSLLETGRDETGRKWPLVFSSLNGYQLPGSTYILLPSVQRLSLNEFSVRFPFAVFGTLAVIATYFIVRKLFPNDNRFAFWSMFVFAINPWGIFFSRIASSAGLALSSFLLGYACLLWVERRKILFLPAFFFIAFSLYSDKVAWLVVPFFLLFYFIYSKKKEVLALFVLTLLAFIPLLSSYTGSPQFLVDTVNNDFKIFSDISILNGISLMRGDDLAAGQPFLGKLFYNKLFYLEKLFENFLRHLNPRFYFAAGDQNTLHGLSNFGPMLLVFLPITLFAVWKIIKEKLISLKLLAAGFFFGAMPSFLAFPSPDQEKSLFLFPILAIITGYGLSQIKKKPALFFFGFLLVLNLSFVFYDGLLKEPLRFEEKWQHGYVELAKIVADKREKYENIYITDSYGADPGPILLFYSKYSPAKFLAENKVDFNYRNWITKIGNIQIDNKESWQEDGPNLYVYSFKDKEYKDWLANKDTKEKNIRIIDNLNKETVYLLFGDEKN